MSRMSHAKFRNETNPMNAYDVDANYDDYSEVDRREFECLFCGTQVQFSRGKSHDDPHFKNWPRKDHKEFCKVLNATNQLDNYRNNDVNLESLVSTILPRAMRPSAGNSPKGANYKKREKRYTGRHTRKFIYDIKNVLDPINKYQVKDEYSNLKFLTEDNEYIYITDIILSQDDIIERFKLKNRSSFICILKATVSKVTNIKGSYIISMTQARNPKEARYGNTQEFRLYMNYNFVEKNKKRIDSLKDSLILCYGIATKSKYGYQLELYSIQNQIVVLRTFS